MAGNIRDSSAAPRAPPPTQSIEDDVEEGAGKHVSNLGCVAGSTSDEANFTAAAAAAAADGCMGEQEKASDGRTDAGVRGDKTDGTSIHSVPPVRPLLAEGGAEGGRESERTDGRRRASNVLYPN